MRLTFTKGAGKYDALLIERGGRADERIECPKQGIIPHDMVHYAVESVVGHGFLGLVANGAPAAFTTSGGAEEEAVERLVECFQAEMWGGRVPAAELLAAYDHACAARGHAAMAVSETHVDAIRARLDELSRVWAAVPVLGALVLEL
ncbi:hypothetical protein [Sphingomonas sp. LHG3443-2]|uniref:hypothetical protein n=1 Tax=Sphingomonas sp. LHG3443-2 TaxID=2804639 RepID=UPI003CF72EC2